MRPKQVFLIICIQSATFLKVAAINCSNCSLHCHIIRYFLCEHGLRPAGRNLNRCQKTSTHRDLIRGSRWRSSWHRQDGRCESSKCATSAKPNRKKIISANGRTGSNRLKAVEESSSKKAVNGDLPFQTCCILSFIWDDKRLSYFSQKSLTLSCLQKPAAEIRLLLCAVIMNVPHALIILQERRVDKSLGEVQLTGGMGKVQIRRKRQSMVMARAFAPVTSKTSAKVAATGAVA